VSSEWEGLGRRLQRRLARTIDVLSILFFDAVVLVVANGLLWCVDRFTSDKSALFKAVKDVSHASLVLLYIAWVAWDVWEFVRDSPASSK
jgi:diacylglycerol kinase